MENNVIWLFVGFCLLLYVSIIHSQNSELRADKKSLKKQLDEGKEKNANLEKSLIKKEKECTDFENKVIAINEKITDYEQQINFLISLNNDKIIPQAVQYEKICNVLTQKKNIFITGGAGVGKSYILKQLKEKYKEKMVLTACSGVAAVNINGMTVHSFLGIGRAEKSINEVLEDINKKENTKNGILKCEILVIDEISMCSAYLLEYIEEVLRRIKKNDEPFGGTQIVAVGDFYQLPPVIDKKKACPYTEVCNCTEASKAQNDCEKRTYCFNSKLFESFEIIELNEIKRQNEKAFAFALNRVRTGRDLEKISDYFKAYVIDEETAKNKDVIKLFTDNNKCNNYNKEKMDALKTSGETYHADDRYEPADNSSDRDIPSAENITGELNRNSRFKEKLGLKRGCRVMLVYNLDTSCGLCNGAMGTVEDLTQSYVEVNFDKIGTVTIKREEFCLETPEGRYIRKQIPLIVAYAITIHKSQGLTLNNACIDINSCFDYGQAYVALSRLSSTKGLYLINDCKLHKIAKMANEYVCKFYEKNKKRV